MLVSVQEEMYQEDSKFIDYYFCFKCIYFVFKTAQKSDPSQNR